MDDDQQQPTSPSLVEQNLDQNRIVKHIMVIGFHHKHGYQVDYCYPPLEPGGPVFSTPASPIHLPSNWKTLPLLCLPDGSHNYDSDTIYFTMPDLQVGQHDADSNSQQPAKAQQQQDSPSRSPQNLGIKTIFGTACYRQIQADKLLNRTDDMTRIAVQKSVCVLSTQPLFGLIRSKLEMITHAYFDELDFSKVKILKLTYDNLNSLLVRDSIIENATFLGLSARHLVSHFGCNMLVLFKAMLLEKKILFYKSPVRDLCSTIMSMCSLFTGLLENGGLNYSTCDLQLSPTLLEALKLLSPEVNDELDSQASTRLDKVFFSPSKEEVVIISGDSSFSENKGQQDIMDELSDSTTRDPLADQLGSTQGQGIRDKCIMKDNTSDPTDNTGDYEVLSDIDTSKIGLDSEDIDALARESIVKDPYALKLSQLKPEEFGLPLQIFARGSFCLPYLSISYLDLLSDKRVRSFVIGATNFLFKQRKEMYDIVVDMEENSITINDTQLKKCLSLTIEDLRFMDYLTRHVRVDTNKGRDDCFDPINYDITNWLGGDEWIRYHFKLYTLYLLKCSKNSASSELFNSHFVQAWKQTTNNYKIWESTGKSSILDGLQSKHPFSSTVKGLNFSDVKLKLSYAVNSSEKGRIVNQTLNGIGKWSIWNNIASAAIAATNVATTATTSGATTNAPAQSPTTSTNARDTTNSFDRQPERKADEERDDNII